MSKLSPPLPPLPPLNEVFTIIVESLTSWCAGYSPPLSPPLNPPLSTKRVCIIIIESLSDDGVYAVPLYMCLSRV